MEIKKFQEQIKKSLASTGLGVYTPGEINESLHPEDDHWDEGTTALMVVNEKALQDKVNEEFRSIKPMNARNLKDNVGRKDGRREGESTNINAGING